MKDRVAASVAISGAIFLYVGVTIPAHNSDVLSGGASLLVSFIIGLLVFFGLCLWE